MGTANVSSLLADGCSLYILVDIVVRDVVPVELRLVFFKNLDIRNRVTENDPVRVQSGLIVLKGQCHIAYGV